MIATTGCGLATDLKHSTAPHRVDLPTALRRKWFVALMTVCVLVGGAVAIGLSRPPNYTATAILSVGRLYTSNAGGIAGMVEARQALASAYSRAIQASEVRKDAARRLTQASTPASGRLSASPIPESPLIKVSAESLSESEAVALANAASAALARYVARQGRSENDTHVFSAYERAAVQYRRSLSVSRELARRYDRHRTQGTKSARDRAVAAADAARLRRDALGASYQGTVQGELSSPALEVFSPATLATNDRSSTLQILVFMGLIGGLAAGTALALFSAYRRSGRSSAE
jgi:hypothetical protein